MKIKDLSASEGLKIKMQDDLPDDQQTSKSKRKDKFKKNAFVLKLIEFLNKLPNDNISKRSEDQLFRSGN